MLCGSRDVIGWCSLASDHEGQHKGVNEHGLTHYQAEQVLIALGWFGVHLRSIGAAFAMTPPGHVRRLALTTERMEVE